MRTKPNGMRSGSRPWIPLAWAALILAGAFVWLRVHGESKAKIVQEGDSMAREVVLPEENGNSVVQALAAEGESLVSMQAEVDPGAAAPDLSTPEDGEVEIGTPEEWARSGSIEDYRRLLAWVRRDPAARLPLLMRLNYQFKNPEVKVALLGILDAAEDETTEYAASTALMSVYDREVVDHLADRMGATGFGEASLRFENALLMLRDPAGVPYLMELAPDLETVLQDPVALVAAETLALIGTPEAVAHLSALLLASVEAGQNASGALAAALNAASQPEAERFLRLLALCREGLPAEVRVAAIRALANYPPQADVVDRLLEDPDPAIRAGAEVLSNSALAGR